MFSKIFTGLFVVALACCLYGYTTLQFPLEDRLDISGIKATRNASDYKDIKDIETQKARFLQCVYDISELSSISKADSNLWHEAKQYFPQINQFKNHNLSLQYISSKDDTHLIFYELRPIESANKAALFLANFSNQGKLVDQLKLKDISFDGTLSINLVDLDIIEVEYMDFFVKNHFTHSKYFIQKHDAHSKLGYCPVPEPEVILEKRYIEYTDFDYYKIGSDQQFQQLSRNTNASEDRSFPQAASRIISKEALSLLKEDELELMRNEIYASHGLIFKDTTWSNYFSKKEWYIANQTDVADLLSDVERINIEHILAIAKLDYSFSNR